MTKKTDNLGFENSELVNKKCIRWDDLDIKTQNKFLMRESGHLEGKAELQHLSWDNTYETYIEHGGFINPKGELVRIVPKCWNNDMGCLFYKKDELDVLAASIRTTGKLPADAINTWGKIPVGVYPTINLFKRYPLKGKDVVIFGSVKLYFEAIVLGFGGKPTTIDHQKIVTDHPDLKTMTVDEYKENPIKFDMGISFSSFEHDGLGRYGDPIDPDADLKTMQNCKNIIKKDGLLFLSLGLGKDIVYFNGGRVYGEHRWPLLIDGWEEIERVPVPIEPIMVLKNI